jgi:hypothetical protein
MTIKLTDARANVHLDLTMSTEKYIDAATFREAIDRARTGGTE